MQIVKWGPLNPKKWTEEKAIAHRTFCEARGISVSWSCYVRLQHCEDVIKSGKVHRGHTGRLRIWGPTDGTWTKQKSKAHCAYCWLNKRKLSWDEYQKEIAEKQTTQNTIGKALLRSPSEIVAKILAKVG